jgi:hypothetical protein
MNFYLSAFFLLIFGSPWTQVSACKENSEINSAIIRVVQPTIGKKIERGECWDLVQYALNNAKASWDGLNDFGQEYDPKKACVQPGDVIRFEKVQLEWKDEKGNGYTEQFGHHYAIVYAVSADGVLTLIHQNTGQHGRKVGLTTMDLRHMTKGKLIFFRPEV